MISMHDPGSIHGPHAGSGPMGPIQDLGFMVLLQGPSSISLVQDLGSMISMQDPASMSSMQDPAPWGMIWTIWGCLGPIHLFGAHFL